MADLVKVLSIDGGGIRGILPAMVLSEIEKRTGRRVSALFDLVAGTSTRGILAPALTRPPQARTPADSAGDLGKIYVDERAPGFSRSPLHGKRNVRTLL